MIQNQMFCYNLRWIVDFYLRDGWNNNRKEKTEKGIAIIAFIVLFPSLVVVLFSSPASALEIHYGTPFVIEEHASEMCSELGRPAPTGTGWVFLMRQNSQGRTGDTYFYESQYPYTFNAAYWPPFYPGYNNYAEEIVQCGGTWVKRTDYTHIPIYAQIPPVSGFDATPQSGRAPLTVQFTDSSSGSPTSFYWEFGDNTTSTQKNPLHTYLTGGNFTVSHSATNTGGTGWRNLTGFISVENPLPLPNIYYGVPFVVLDNASDICTELRRPAPTGTGWVFLMRQYGQGRTGDTYYYDYQYPYTFNAAYWPPFYPNYSNAYVREIVQCGGTWYDRAGFTHIPIYEFPPPTANFTATPLSGPAPLIIR